MFETYVGHQMDAAAHSHDGTLIAISAFYHVTGSPLQYYVGENGHAEDYRVGGSFPSADIQDTHSRQLSEGELHGLYAALQRLPTTSVLPPVERLLVVSFRAGPDWITRSYDSAALPGAMREIYNLLGGERFETRDRRSSQRPNKALQRTAGAGGVPLEIEPLLRPGGG